MTKERFSLLRFRSHMEVDYVHKKLINGRLSCMLLAIDFDNDTVKLKPFLSEEYEDNEFWCSIDYFDLPKKKMKVVK